MESDGKKKSRQSNASLGKARAAKNDEFYTRWDSIEEEVWHYREHFRGAVVYCNCDDPKVSNFYKYFNANFGEFGLRRLLTTCYKNQDAELFSKHDKESAVSVEFDGVEERINYLRRDGDFRSPESIALLQRADIVCTNPPFSLFREYVAQLAESGKKFLVIGNMNAIATHEIFRLIHDGKLWLGNKSMGTDMLFNVPPHFAEWLRENKKEGSGYRIVDGGLLGRASAIWFTNMDHKKRHEELILVARYNESEYPNYDNYDAINVNRVADIPRDYAGVMGVPISFLDKWNPDQFEVLDCINRYSFLRGSTPETQGKYLTRVGGKSKFTRMIIRNKKPE